MPSALTEFPRDVSRLLTSYASALPEPLRSPVLALIQSRGKGVRSMLLAACSAFGSADHLRLVRLGALVELLHLASLLHDDVVDRAATRRGVPAAHLIVGREHALLAGLSCTALAGTEAAALGGGLDILVSRTLAYLATGEIRDVERAFDTTLGLSDYLELVRRKTSVLFRFSCLLGAAKAGISGEAGRALGTFGEEAGVTFQVLDDCLDLSATVSGKPAGTDHLLGLFGAPTLYALRNDANGELRELLLSPAFGPGDLPRVRDLVASLGGLGSALSLAREHYAIATSALDGLPPGPRQDLLAVASVMWRDIDGR